jgi:hypothetical protein
MRKAGTGVLNFYVAPSGPQKRRGKGSVQYRRLYWPKP